MSPINTLQHHCGRSVNLTFDYRSERVHTVEEQKEAAKHEPEQLLEQWHCVCLLQVAIITAQSIGIHLSVDDKGFCVDDEEVSPVETEERGHVEDAEEHKVGVDIPPAEPPSQLPSVRGVQKEEEPAGCKYSNAANRSFKKLYAA